MHTRLTLAALVMLGIACSSSLQAQQGRGRGAAQQRVTRTALLRIDAVQKEIELTDDQIEQLGEISRDRGRAANEGKRGEGKRGEGKRGEGKRGEGKRGEGQGDQARQRGGRSLEQAQAEIDRLSEVLLDHQIQRVNEIFVQVRGVSALQDPLVAKGLEVSDEQKQQMREIQSKLRSEIRGLAEAENRREQMAEMMSVANQEMMDVLTDSQKESFASMKGKTIDLPDDAFRRGRRNRGDRQRPDGDGDGR